ncbi:YhgE/Pip family protein [uncultured Amnibacterium sp.]|uniref:YhgE/Pip domain-containing protein n=1 Tax=uncultured Amnibacterium sp. TaxID=1631851 RepID=UPI0035CAA4AF
MSPITFERAGGVKRAGLLTVIGIALIPVTVGGVLLLSLHNPTGRLKSVTAAIVNEDAGVKLNGQTVPLGRELAGTLVKGTKNAAGTTANYTWVLTKKADAASGLNDGRYTAVVTIPKQFSKAATSYSDADTARQATIQVATSDQDRLADGAISTAIANTATEVLGRTLTKGYLSNIYVGFNTLHTSLGKAATGAKKITSGLESTTAGTRKLASGQTQLASGTSSLAAGLHKLADGSAQTTSGTTTLADGTSSLASGTSKLAGGLKKLAAGAHTTATGADSLASGSQKIASGTSSLAAGLHKLSDGAAALPAQTKQLADGAAGVASGVQALTQFPPDTTLAEVDAALKKNGSSLQQLAGGASGIASGTAALSGGLSSISSGIASSASGASSLASGARQVSGGTTKLAGGLDQLADGTTASAKGARSLATGTSSLASGAHKLADGSAQITAGIRSSATGADQLASGSSSLASGTTKLASGSAALAKGQSTLASGLGTAADKLPTYSAAQRTNLAAAVAQPVVAPNSGGLSMLTRSGLPVLISLCLWLGAFAIYLLLQAASRRALTSSRSSVALALGGYLPGLVIGALQGLALAAISQIALQLDVGAWFALAGVAVVIGASFAAVTQGLTAILGGVGRFLIVVVAALALATSLISTAPDLLVTIASVLPTAPAATAVLDVITGTAGVGGALVSLVVWGLIGLLLTTLAVARSRTVSARRLQAITTA